MKYAALFLTIIFLLTGCGINDGNETPVDDNAFSDAPSEVIYNPPQRSKVFLHAVKPLTLNPIVAPFSVNRDVSALVFEPLVSVKNDYSVGLKLAEGYVISEEGRRITVNLRSGVKWHDGSGFSAADVSYTYNQILENKESSVYYENIENIESLTASGNGKIDIKLKKADSGFVRMLTFPIIKNKSVTENGFACIGTGMYRVENYTVNESITLKANDLWWGGAVNISEIDVNLVPDTSSSYSGFKMNSMDAVITDYNDSGKYTAVKGIETAQTPSNKYAFMSVNIKKTVLADAALRKIIKNIVSTEKITKDLIPNYSALCSSPVNPAAQYAVSDVPIEDIKAELEKNGYVQGETSRIKEIDGITHKLIFDVLVNENSPSSVMLGEHAASALQKYGIMLEVIKKEGTEYANAAVSGKYDFVICETEISANYDLSFLLGTGGSLNIGGYSSEETDEILNLINTSENDGDRAKYFQRLQNVFFKDMPHIPLCFYYKCVLYNSDLLENVIPGSIGSELDGINDWNLKAQK